MKLSMKLAPLFLATALTCASAPALSQAGSAAVSQCDQYIKELEVCLQKKFADQEPEYSSLISSITQEIRKQLHEHLKADASCADAIKGCQTALDGLRKKGC